MRELTDLEKRRIDALVARIPDRVRALLTKMLQKCERPLAEDEVVASKTEAIITRREFLPSSYGVWNPETDTWDEPV